MAANEPKRILSEHFRAGGRPKRRFATREQAEKRARKHYVDLVIYFCDFCEGWHFATPRRRRAA
jgi:hypothetical protein